MHVAGVGKIGLHLGESQQVGKEPCALEFNVDALRYSGDDKDMLMIMIHSWHEFKAGVNMNRREI